ncbi:MAG TPA: hypothetical protein H9924_08955, partial [Candidatus Phocaeicola merdavium]|nr:hypothetical protein [Candidatus Phocaeicola merdavium]
MSNCQPYAVKNAYGCIGKRSQVHKQTHTASSSDEAVCVCLFYYVRIRCKRLITFFLSIAFLIVAVTGILLVAYVEGPGSSIGLWHYKLGI